MQGSEAREGSGERALCPRMTAPASPSPTFQTRIVPSSPPDTRRASLPLLDGALASALGSSGFAGGAQRAFMTSKTMFVEAESAAPRGGTGPLGEPGETPPTGLGRREGEEAPTTEAPTTGLGRREGDEASSLGLAPRRRGRGASPAPLPSAMVSVGVCGAGAPASSPRREFSGASGGAMSTGAVDGAGAREGGGGGGATGASCCLEADETGEDMGPDSPGSGDADGGGVARDARRDRAIAASAARIDESESLPLAGASLCCAWGPSWDRRARWLDRLSRDDCVDSREAAVVDPAEPISSASTCAIASSTFSSWDCEIQGGS